MSLKPRKTGHSSRREPLPREVEETVLVLYEHFRRTGQRRYWEVEGADNQAVLDRFLDRDYYEVVRNDGRYRVLLTGIGIDYARSRWDPLAGPRRGDDEEILVPGLKPAVMKDPGMLDKPTPRPTPKLLLDALRDELERSDLEEGEREELRRRIVELWRDPAFLVVLERALDDMALR